MRFIKNILKCQFLLQYSIVWLVKYIYIFIFHNFSHFEVRMYPTLLFVPPKKIFIHIAQKTSPKTQKIYLSVRNLPNGRQGC